MRSVSKLLLKPQVMWIQLAQINIQRSLATSLGCKSRRLWSTIEGILLMDDLHITLSPFLCDLIHGFHEASHYLLFVEEEATLPPDLSIEQLLLLFKAEHHLTST